MSQTRVLAIAGPTAIGKSSVALAVAQHLGGEIISIDSMQIYRGMDIGTAKPSTADRQAVPHHLIDVRNPDEAFSVAEFRQAADDAIAGVRARGRLPVLVGGTGFYLRAVLRDYNFAGQSPDAEVRRRLTAAAVTQGSPALYQRLAAVDPVTAVRLHPNDTRRIVRALEVWELTGRSMSDQQGAGIGGARYEYLLFGLTMERSELYRRIDQRVLAMLAAGWLDEVEGLLRAGYAHTLPALRSLGYRDLTLFLRGLATWPETVTWIQRNTRRFAKRQWTWLRREEDLGWIDAAQGATAAAAEILSVVAGKWGTTVEASFGGVGSE